MQELTVPTQSRTEFVDITAEVNRAVHAEGVAEGVCHVFVPHTTAGVTINENADPDVTRDVMAVLERLVPRDAGYRHAEGNSDAHAKASLVGSSLTVPVAAGRLVLGTWQAIYFCEFDGPRHRRCLVAAIAK
ncbi:MAG: YjbQ family protein [Planctomycetes bacterium]|nr:YjbQ family protein [Planctomycetota bacterium]